MADENVTPFKLLVKFGVRHDKNRGILIETMETVQGNVYVFKYHDQALNRHCQQVQNIVKAGNVQRAKKIHVDVTEFLYEYFRIADNKLQAEFRANRLQSTQEQMEKVYSMRLNKEAGILKRQLTAAGNKQAKIVARNERLSANFNAIETAFQEERARRISLLNDEARRRNQGRGNGGGNGGGNGEGNGGGNGGGNRGDQNGGAQHSGVHHEGYQGIAAQTVRLLPSGGVKSIIRQAGEFQFGANSTNIPLPVDDSEMN